MSGSSMRSFDAYTICSGAFSNVYKALDLTTNKKVASK
jgi:serine/threonine protein kinase